MAERTRDDLVLLAELIEAGKVKPVIDRRYPLSEVPEAIRYLEAGHVAGEGRHHRLEQLGDQRRRSRGAVGLDRPVVDLAPDLLGDRRARSSPASPSRSPCSGRRRSARAGGARGSSARSGGGAGSRGTAAGSPSAPSTSSGRPGRRRGRTRRGGGRGRARSGGSRARPPGAASPGRSAGRRRRSSAARARAPSPPGTRRSRAAAGGRRRPSRRR